MGVGQYWLVYIETSFLSGCLSCVNSVQWIKSPEQISGKFGGCAARFRSSVKEKPPSSSPPSAKAWWLACQNLQDFVGWFENKGRVAAKAARGYFLRFFSSSKSCQFESGRYSSDITGISLECNFSLLSGISRLRSELPPPLRLTSSFLMGIFERFGIMRSILTVECVGWFGTKEYLSVIFRNIG